MVDIAHIKEFATALSEGKSTSGGHNGQSEATALVALALLEVAEAIRALAPKAA